MDTSSSFKIFATFFLLGVATTVAQDCTFLPGVSLPGLDLATFPSVDSREACCLECRTAVGCTAFTFFVSGPNANKCVMKKAINNPVADATATSGISTGSCTFDPGFEYPLFNISTFRDVSNKESCCVWCTSTIKCVAFSYFTSGPKAGNCELKFALNNRLASPDRVAGASTPGTATCTYEAGITYRGFEYKSVQAVASKESCCALCKADPLKCTALTYVQTGPSAKTCVLRSGTANRIPNANAISGQGSGSSCGVAL